MSNHWHPSISPKQIALGADRKRFVLASGPRRSSKCVAADTIIQTGNGLMAISRFAPLPPGGESQHPTAKGVRSFSQTKHLIETARCTHVIRDLSTTAIQVKTSSGHELKGSNRHPIWCYYNDTFSYKTLPEVMALVRSGAEVWVPIVAGHDAWTKADLTTIACQDLNMRESRKRADDDRMDAVLKTLPVGQIPKIGTLSRLAGVNWMCARRFLKHGAIPKEISVVLDDDLAYLLGLLAGDGSCTEPVLRNHNIGFASIDETILNEFKRILAIQFPESALRHRGGCDWSVSGCARLIAVIRHLGMNKYSHEKVIPDVVIESPKSVVRAFLQGLFDTDGWVDTANGQVGYASSSRILAQQVQQLLLAFGLNSYRAFYPNSHKGSWKMSLRNDSFRFSQEIGFRLPRKQNKIKNKNCHPADMPPGIIERLKSIWATRGARGLIGAMSRKERKHTVEALLRHSKAPSRRNIFRFLTAMKVGHYDLLAPFMLDQPVVWERLVSAEPASADLYDISVQENHSFVGNGFINHNTRGFNNAVAWHLWNTPQAYGVMIGKTVDQNLNGGAWQDLLEYVLPQWFAGDFGFEMVTSPRMEAVSHRYYFETTNQRMMEDRDCGPSRFYLASLDNEANVEAGWKGKRFSLIYWTELSNFKQRKTFDALQECLRPLGPEDKVLRQMFCDTNPADEGEDSWIWQLWYWFRTVDLDNMNEDEASKLGFNGLSEDKKPAMLTALKGLQQQLALHEFSLDDNIYLTDQDKAEQMAKYAHSQDLFDRYYHGLWKKASGLGLFSEVWKPHIHIIGETGIEKPDGDILVPETDTFEMGTGWDIGSRNSAFAIVEKFVIEPKPGLHQPAFKILDEVVVLGEEMKLQWFVEEVMEKTAEWERIAGRKFLWRNWSDQSSFSRYDNIADTYEHAEVFRVSEGQIMLQAIFGRGAKTSGSVERRADLIRKLLFEDRIWVNGPRCPNIIAMFDGLKRNRRGTVDKASIYKHAFDAVSYYIVMECWTEMVGGMSGPRTSTTTSSGIITTGL